MMLICFTNTQKMVPLWTCVAYCKNQKMTIFNICTTHMAEKFLLKIFMKWLYWTFALRLNVCVKQQTFQFIIYHTNMKSDSNSFYNRISNQFSISLIGLCFKFGSIWKWTSLIISNYVFIKKNLHNDFFYLFGVVWYTYYYQHFFERLITTWQHVLYSLKNIYLCGASGLWSMRVCGMVVLKKSHSTYESFKETCLVSHLDVTCEFQILRIVVETVTWSIHVVLFRIWYVL